MKLVDIRLILSIVLALGLVACASTPPLGGGGSPQPAAPTDSPVTIADQAVTAAPAEGAPDVAKPTASTEDGWEFGAEVYLWAASVGAKSKTGGDIDVSFRDLASNLNMGLMAVLGAQHGKWSITADLLYLDVETEADSRILPGRDLLDVELQGLVVTPTVGYSLIEDEGDSSLEVLAGVRYLDLKTTVKTPRRKATDSGAFWDGIVGVRGDLYLSEKWFIPYYADIGTGESDLTWQLLGGIGYKFGDIHAVLAYRYLSWDLGNGGALKDLNFSGPLLGIRFTF
jgi:hypothetical protein